MLTQKMKQPFKTAQPVLFPPLADRAKWESLPGAARWVAAPATACLFLILVRLLRTRNNGV